MAILVCGSKGRLPFNIPNPELDVICIPKEDIASVHLVLFDLFSASVVKHIRGIAVHDWYKKSILICLRLASLIIIITAIISISITSDSHT